jgi:hypothetical protein
MELAARIGVAGTAIATCADKYYVPEVGPGTGRIRGMAIEMCIAYTVTSSPEVLTGLSW